MQLLNISQKPLKTTKRSKPSKPMSKKQADAMTLPERIRAAYSKDAVAAITGTIWGSSIPVGTWWTAHHDLASHPLMWMPVLGGIGWSAIKMYSFNRQAFRLDTETATNISAAGAVALTEVLMSFSPHLWVSVLFLAILSATNGIFASVNLQTK